MILNSLIALAVLCIALILLAHMLWRYRSGLAAKDWRALSCKMAKPGQVFDPAMVSKLPAPVQRFFCYSIAPGTPLYLAAELRLYGQFSFSATQGKSAVYLPLLARQLLRAPEGMIWEARIGAGLKAFQGSDGLLEERSWTQFAWRNLLPVALISRNRDHYRSATGRMLAESVFWTPTALLTMPSVQWEAHGNNMVVATIQHRSLTTAITLKLDAQGEASEVSFMRWSNANPDRKYRLQPFGGHLSDYKEFNGVRVPTQVEAGNFFGTEDYFPFYKVRVEQLQWLGATTIIRPNES